MANSAPNHYEAHTPPAFPYKYKYESAAAESKKAQRRAERAAAKERYRKSILQKHGMSRYQLRRQRLLQLPTPDEIRRIARQYLVSEERARG
jgi:hypothetical protein